MLLFLDVETTGLPSRRNASYRDVHVWPRIVSISWALFDAPSKMAVHRYSIVRPDAFTIPLEATRIHGITTERAQSEGREMDEVLVQLLTDLAEHRPQLLVAHNVHFDRPIVLAEFLRKGMDLTLERLPLFCTMLETTKLCRIPRAEGGYKWPSLNELHFHLYGVSLEGAHNASSDVLNCAKCYFRLVELGLAAPT